MRDALEPFYSLRNAFGSNPDNAVDPAGSAAVRGAVGGPLRELSYTVAAALEAVIGVICALSLGADVAVNVLPGALVGVGVPLGMAVTPALVAPTPPMVIAEDNWSSDYCDQGSQSPTWQSWIGAFGYGEAGPSNEDAATQLAVQRNDPPLAEAHAMEWFAGVAGGLQATVSEVVFTSTSLVLEFASAAGGPLNDMLGTMDAVVFSMDAVSGILEVKQLSAAY